MTRVVDSKVKGGRRAFFDDPDVDRLLAMLMRLATEHWALKERVLVLEKLLEEKSLLDGGQIDAYRPSAETDAAWDRESHALMQDIIEAARNIERKE